MNQLLGAADGRTPEPEEKKLSRDYPRSFYKGTGESHEHLIAQVAAEEAEFRKDGFVNGHEFFGGLAKAEAKKGKK